jgi:hypothetical protein
MSKARPSSKARRDCVDGSAGSARREFALDRREDSFDEGSLSIFLRGKIFAHFETYAGG